MVVWSGWVGWLVVVEFSRRTIDHRCVGVVQNLRCTWCKVTMQLLWLIAHKYNLINVLIRITIVTSTTITIIIIIIIIIIIVIIIIIIIDAVLIGSDVVHMHNIVNTELVKVTDWCGANCLSLSVKKTVYMIFRGSRKKLSLDDLFICIAGSPVSRVGFLGFFLWNCTSII